jgi:hypothetical protein
LLLPFVGALLSPITPELSAASKKASEEAATQRKVQKDKLAPYQDKLSKHKRGIRKAIAIEEVYNEMNRRDFEDNIVKYFESKGTVVKRIPCEPLPHHEYTDEYAGCNLVVGSVVVQCAIGPTTNKKGDVGTKAVKRFAEEMKRFPSKEAFVLVSRTGFTRQGRELAEAHNIKLKVRGDEPTEDKK